MKFMNKKRVASAALAGALALSMVTPAFATSNTPAQDPNSTKIEGAFQATDIDVVVTQTASAIINPFGLDVKMHKEGAEITDDTPAADIITISGQQIVSSPMALQNKTAMDLNAGVSMTATVKDGSEMRFTTATTGGTGATKNIFAYLQAKQSDITGVPASVDSAMIAAKTAAWAASAYDADKDLVVNGNMAATTDSLVTLRAADVAADGTVTYKNGSVALVRLSGDCVSAPVTGEWTTADGFTINVAYTFRPAAVTKYNVTLADVVYNGGGSGIPEGSTTVAADYTKAAEGDVVTISVTSINTSQVTVTATTPGENGDETIQLTPVAPATANANGTDVDFTAATGALTGTMTFEMPAGDVTITVTNNN